MFRPFTRSVRLARPGGPSVVSPRTEDSNDGFNDETAALAIFNLHNPEIRVVTQLPREIFSCAAVVTAVSEGPQPDKFLTAPRLRQNQTRTVQPVHLDQNGAGFLRAAPQQVSCSTCRFAAADQRLDIDSRFQPHHCSTLDGLPVGTQT